MIIKVLRFFFLYILLASTSPMTPVNIHLGWIHQSNFSGFYAADQLGYYAAEGLAVSSIKVGDHGYEA